MKDHKHRHPARLDTRGRDTLPDVDISKPEFAECDLDDVFNGLARQQAIDWMQHECRRIWRGAAGSEHQYTNALGQITEAVK